MNKPILISFVIASVLIGWAFWVVSGNPGVTSDAAPVTAIMENGRQFIDISAKGGYSPRVVVAKAGVPTTLRMKTNGTFDCSASVVIPKISYQKLLAPTETTDIEIAAEQAQGTLQGLCSMGMYSFQIKFQ